ncbi:NAD-dependent succinate-semialdehyde dehydrogenase [Verticiella sediminum]|uniref:NAD-dependent succinate-semialdehyde dehydrogenase n=1 Tax=Verticiella sediminum TaxID=1247510 RepID=A0A556A9H9_9BURK|nr:NAD-dependent succinate-semialdehyde dehydrogenase [Verticiella sediminum]TSH89548.1 NAD-dependent succinate-semialdehyde dehydrogenase [Verticiella sediminum]
MTHAYPDTALLIGGQWREARSGRRIAVRNPANGEVIGHVAHAGIADLDEAIRWAEQGYRTWRAMCAHERQAILRGAADLLRARASDIARLLTLEQGKPLREAEVELEAAATITEWFADEAMRRYGRIVPPRKPGVVQQVLVEPVGPVAAFTPWNFPVNQVVRKLAAALAAGCSFLCKAPEETPASPAAMFQAFLDAGVPAGVLGLVYGDPAEISGHLIASEAIRKVTFTGSTQVGKHLAALAGRHMKRSTMELGGHAPVIVAEDADIGLAVQAMAAAKLRNAGQVCISPTRFLVHRDVKAEFVKGLLDHLGTARVGDGMDPATTMGPLANERRVAAMHQMVNDAQAKGAELLLGSQEPASGGYFHAPTVLDDVPLASDIMIHEPFGPVIALRTFERLDDALAEANRLPFGLAAYGFTRSLKTMHALTQGLEAGLIWLNQPALALPEMPFGGVKDSGYGSEGGPEALDAYSVVKSVSAAML